MGSSNSSVLTPILNCLVDGVSLTDNQQQQLASWMLDDPLRANAFGVTATNISQVIQKRSQLLQRVYPAVQQLWQDSFKIQAPCLETLWNLWLPLAVKLAEVRKSLKRPLIQGFLGVQGTGKTTLTAILILILGHLGYSALSLSLDDLYKTYAERQRLQEQDPRLIWRGPPGTHDIELGIQVLDQLGNPKPGQAPIVIPRFDKFAYGGAGDRTKPEIFEPVDIILFEGWFVGVRPIDPVRFDTAPPPILTAADRQFAKDMNIKLQDYLPLWNRLNSLIVLNPIDYRLSQQWRQQAEQQTKRKHDNKSLAADRLGMSDAEVKRFVEYFWRALHPDLFIKPLIQDTRWVDLVIEINSDHLPGAIYSPLGVTSFYSA
jgi:D-glycerate 3-kinase